MRMTRLSTVALVLTSTAACAALEPARMALPDGLSASTEEVVLRGLGRGREGEYTLAGNRGRFRRTNDRLDVFDIVSVDWGGSSVTVGGADVTAAVSAKCGLRRSLAVTAGTRPYLVKAVSRIVSRHPMSMACLAPGA